MDGGFGDAGNSELPWASVFDSTANARALSAIQSEGFRAASELVDRCVRIAAKGLGGANQFVPPATARTHDERADILGATNLEPLIRGWWSMVGQYLQGSIPDSVPRVVREPGSTDQPASFDFSNAETKGALGLEAAISSAALADVWLHNTGAEDRGEIRLRCSDLMADHGGVVRAGAVTFSPAAVPMPGRSTRGIGIEIKVADDIVPGVYRGNLLAEGYPKLWLSVVLTVRPLAS
jgi:hypothetical protein